MESIIEPTVTLFRTGVETIHDTGVDCTECGDPVSFYVETDRNGDTVVKVRPCECCLENRGTSSYDEGYDSGWDEGNREGYSEAEREAEREWSDQVEEARRTGFDRGFEAGILEGQRAAQEDFDDSLEDEYNRGFAAGQIAATENG